MKKVSPGVLTWRNTFVGLLGRLLVLACAGVSLPAFNGLAHVLLPSTREADEIKVTASTDGLKTATAVQHTQLSVP